MQYDGIEAVNRLVEETRSEYKLSCRSLKAWFMAYGVGAPAVVLSNKDVLGKVVESGWALWITLLFLGAVFLQITSAIVTKGALRSCTILEKDGVAYRKSESPVLDKAERFFQRTPADWVTLGMYAAATVLAIMAVMAK